MASIHAHRMIRALERLGWMVDRSSGSHKILTMAGRPRLVIPVHRGGTLKEGLARGILKDAGIGEDEFFDVY
jgi:predicted RNA binding protein YcfA (HicA-like mRNA interferase family)